MKIFTPTGGWQGTKPVLVQTFVDISDWKVKMYGGFYQATTIQALLKDNDAKEQNSNTFKASERTHKIQVLPRSCSNHVWLKIGWWPFSLSIFFFIWQMKLTSSPSILQPVSSTYQDQNQEQGSEYLTAHIANGCHASCVCQDTRNIPTAIIGPFYFVVSDLPLSTECRFWISYMEPLLFSLQKKQFGFKFLFSFFYFTKHDFCRILQHIWILACH